MDDGCEVLLSRFSAEREESARRLANAIMVAGLYPEMRPPRQPGERWRIVAPAELVPTPDNLAALRQAMRAAADRAGASYDGCEREPEA